MTSTNRTSQAVNKLIEAYRYFATHDALTEMELRGIAEKYKRMEEALEEAKTKLASGSWAASRNGYTETAQAIDETYLKVESALSYDPLSL